MLNCKSTEENNYSYGIGGSSTDNTACGWIELTLIVYSTKYPVFDWSIRLTIECNTGFPYCTLGNSAHQSRIQ